MNPDNLERMILDGLVEVSGIDSNTGEMMYVFTQYAKETFPELQREADEYFNQLILFFWEQGFINMDLSEENPTVTITEKALDKEEVAKLTTEVRSALQMILDALRIK
jgi:hypothetical protein